MELTKQEAVAVEEAVAARSDAAHRELSEVELALIGGGHGDVSWG